MPNLYNILPAPGLSGAAKPQAHEKLWQRKKVLAGEEPWQRLSVPARELLLHHIRVTATPNQLGAPLTPAADVPPDVAEELKAAGFLALRDSQVKKYRGPCYYVPEPMQDVVRFMQHAHKLQLLETPGSKALWDHISRAFFRGELLFLVSQVLLRAEIDPASTRLEDLLPRYVLRRHWLEWVSQVLRKPLAEKVLQVLRDVKQPLRPDEVAAQFPNAHAADVRKILEELIAHLAVLEGVRPHTGELVVGLLPDVLTDVQRGKQAHVQPPLPTAVQPVETGPDDGVTLDDLRAILLEAARLPPRIKQNEQLFQKEVDRFAAGLVPIPDWLVSACYLDAIARLNIALSTAREMSLLEPRWEDNQGALHLTAAGHQWLTSPVSAQFASVYQEMRRFRADPYYGQVVTDQRFLGTNVIVLPAGKERYLNLWNIKTETFEAVRQALLQALQQLPVGEFRRLQEVLPFLTHGNVNPLLLGRKPGEVAVVINQVRLAPLVDELSQAATTCLDGLIRLRLAVVGAMRLGQDQQGQLCIAPTSRLAGYFGAPMTDADWAGPAPPEAKVIVQPDFSIIIMGMNPQPTAELAVFCERVRGHSGQGVVQLKLTRAAVLQAVSGGLEGTDILARLERHASNPVPANIRHEVKEWSSWVRRARAQAMLLLRCPDRTTADRVMAVLAKQAERLAEKLVGLTTGKLTASDRQKLQKEGVVIDGDTGGTAKKPAKKTRRYY